MAANGNLDIIGLREQIKDNAVLVFMHVAWDYFANSGRAPADPRDAFTIYTMWKKGRGYRVFVKCSRRDEPSIAAAGSHKLHLRDAYLSLLQKLSARVADAVDLMDDEVMRLEDDES